MELTRRIVEIYKEKGARGVFIRGLKKMVKIFFETNSALWFERDLTQDLPCLNAKIPATAELFSANETINWIKNNGESWMRNHRELNCALSENHILAHLKYENRIIGYAKVGLNRVHIQDFQKAIALPTGLAFIYDTYVAPEYRGCNLAPFLIQEVMSYFKNIGINKMGCHIPRWNAASLNAYAKLGFRRINFIRYFRILGFKIFTTHPEKIYSLKVQTRIGTLFQCGFGPR